MLALLRSIHDSPRLQQQFVASIFLSNFVAATAAVLGIVCTSLKLIVYLPGQLGGCLDSQSDHLHIVSRMSVCLIRHAVLLFTSLDIGSRVFRSHFFIYFF